MIRLLRDRALNEGKSVRLWRKFGSPSIQDWGEYLKRHGNFHSFGEGNWINPAAFFADPVSTCIGNNVHIAGGFFTCHDGSVNMINLALGTKLDSVAPIRIHDDVFIGAHTIILPGVSIGPRAVIGAGAVVSRDVPENSVAVGSPAKVVASLDDYIEKLRARNLDYPWRGLIEQRVGEHDPALEPELQRLRKQHWFGPHPWQAKSARRPGTRPSTAAP
ncbi:MAG: acyltransferase [Candidatus Devosia phytovorans]|uniref:Acyltransferase n=1 Tax=Candidatus Devosia phytovorans TaxID=3121372 RepID=A0AAJ5VWQ2_9HYPH|nr:acyltransferase [Devosia sp.]WEK05817.1 MAG: acyltransferase [Devosia sp.]